LDSEWEDNGVGEAAIFEDDGPLDWFAIIGVTNKCRLEADLDAWPEEGSKSRRT
jgi:hypothetical protein